MGTGAKVAIGCGCIVLLGTAAVLGVVGAGAWWAKDKLQEVSTGIGDLTAQSEEMERYEKQANANPYTPKPNGVIAEERFLKFLDVRRQVHAVYGKYEAELRDIEKKAESSSDKLTLSELWSAGGSLARMAGAIRLEQMKALASVGMSEGEYRDVQLAVYKSAWASDSETKSGQLPAEAISGAVADAAKQLPEGHLSDEDARKLKEAMGQMGDNAEQALHVPRANVELFRQHEAEIRKYTMHSLAFIGL